MFRPACLARSKDRTKLVGLASILSQVPRSVREAENRNRKAATTCLYPPRSIRRSWQIRMIVHRQRQLVLAGIGVSLLRDCRIKAIRPPAKIPRAARAGGRRRWDHRRWTSGSRHLGEAVHPRQDPVMYVPHLQQGLISGQHRAARDRSAVISDGQQYLRPLSTLRKLLTADERNPGPSPVVILDRQNYVLPNST